MPIVSMPDNTQVQFPDDMPPAQIKSLIQQKFPQAGAAPQGNAISDIGPEIKNEAASNLNAIKNMYGGTAQNGVIQQTLNVGKGLAAIPGLLASPITGAARSLIGHPLASAEHAIGTAIAPDIAAKDNPAEMYNTAKGDVDTAMMGLRPSGATPIGARTITPPVPSIEDISSAAKAGFQNVQQSGAAVTSNAVGKMALDGENKLRGMGLRPKAAPETFDILSELQNPPANSVGTIGDLHEARQALGQAASSPDPRERLAASTAINHLDDYLSNIPAADIATGDPATVATILKQSIANYATMKKAGDVSLRGEKALNNASAANSGMNLENNIRQQLKQIANNPKLQRGFTAQELSYIKKTARGTIPADAIRTLGNFLGGGGGLGAMLTAGAGAMAAGPAGLAAPLAGAALKSLGNSMTARKLAALNQMIRARSPLAQSLSPIPAPLPSPLTTGLLGANFRLPFLMPGVVPTAADQNQ